MTVTLDTAVSCFGVLLQTKLSGRGADGAPEDQLRAPLEALLANKAALGRPRERICNTDWRKF